MSLDPLELEHRLQTIVRQTPWLWTALRVLRQVRIPNAYIAAGAVRNTVWDVLSHQVSAPPTDVDVIYFDAAESASERATEYEAQLRALAPVVHWDATNQATIHRYHQRRLGRTVPASSSIAEALMTWPETATAVAVRLAPHASRQLADRLEVVAPFGLSDLFSMTLRYNGRQAGVAEFWQRVQSKQWLQRWGNLTVEAPETNKS